MNIESYVFLICFVLLGIIALFAVGRLVAVEKELNRKKMIVKMLQKLIRDVNNHNEMQVAALKREIATLKGDVE